jgi:vacuole membrane protein 1
MFSEAYLQKVLSTVGALTPSQWELESKIEIAWGEALQKFHQAGRGELSNTSQSSGGLFSQLWSIFMFIVIGFFAISCINQFAQGYARELQGPTQTMYEDVDEMDSESYKLAKKHL